MVLILLISSRKHTLNVKMKNRLKVKGWENSYHANNSNQKMLKWPYYYKQSRFSKQKILSRIKRSFHNETSKNISLRNNNSKGLCT